MDMEEMTSLEEIAALPRNKWGIAESRSPYPPATGGAAAADGPRRRFVLADGDRVDVVIVPALAFDRAGRRLGHGMGFYGQCATLTGLVSK